MKYYVFFNDDYADNGGIGFEEWDTLELSLTFIESRMKLKPGAKLNCYRLVHGSEMKLQAVETVTKLTANATSDQSRQ